MSDTESVDYLQPGFDPASLTTPRLRSILVTYNISYPSNAKKGDLVALFNAHVAPQASKILARRARAKRSSMGIIDVATESSQSSASFQEPHDRRRRPAAASRPSHAHIQEEQEEQFDEHAEAERRRVQRRSSPRKRQSRSTSYQAAPVATTTHTASDTDTGPDGHARRPPSRRARTKTPQVQVKQEPEEDGTPFTHDNPFQSGSSPLTAASSSAQRRRTPAYESVGSDKERTSSGVREKQTFRATSDGARILAASSPPSHAYMSPAGKQRHSSPFYKAPTPTAEPEPEFESEPEPGYDPLAPGEEFTPEAQLELSQEEEAMRQRNFISRRASQTRRGKELARKRRGGVLSSLATPLWVLALTLLGAYGTWYRQEKLAVGFCGLGRPAVPLLSDQVDRLVDQLDRLEWVPDGVRNWVHDAQVPPNLRVFVEPQCDPCPPHAFCYSDYSVRCENGYIVKPHPLSLGGLVPLPPTCEPDGERARRVKAVADKAVEELRDRRAKWECGDLVEEDGQVPDGPAIDVPVLKEVISEKRSKKMSKEEFDDLWTAAIGDIESRDEVESEPEPMYAATDPGNVPNTRLSSTSLARLPLGCAIRRSVRLGLARYRFPLFLLVVSFLGALYARARYRAHRAALARVPDLVDLVLERLAAQKELWLYDDVDEANAGDDSQEDTSFLHDPFLFLPHLRDDVLRATHSLAARERIWKHVRAIVEQNSNVRTGQREGRNGEVGRAWEWIGPVGIANSSAGNTEMSAPRRRRSGRTSLMPSGGSSGNSRAGSAAPRDSITVRVDGDSHNGGGSSAATPRDSSAGEENRSALHKRWQESRPIY